jgi:hypothetical protein
MAKSYGETAVIGIAHGVTTSVQIPEREQQDIREIYRLIFETDDL